jgi:Ca-activated chloride channel family protein
MTFIWPELLWLLLAVPLAIGLYWAWLRRRSRAALHYASLGVVREALSGSRQSRRHLPPLLLLAALGCLIVAMARPVAKTALPFTASTVVLAIDTSLSMVAQDFEPNRLAAAQMAAKQFIQQRPAHTRLGIVSFAGTAALVQAPTADGEKAIEAVDSLRLESMTAVGSGILVSLKTLFPDEEMDLMGIDPRVHAKDDRTGARSLDDVNRKEAAKPKVNRPGSYSSAAIILLSDGQTTMGPDPIEAARMAAERGVPIYTVGVGTTEGRIISLGNYRFNATLDEDTLKQIADITHGEYFNATDAKALVNIYRNLNAKVLIDRQAKEISALFCAAAAVCAMLAGLLSMLWFSRVADAR